MSAIILSIGDELVLGQTVDTNSAWLSQELAAVGCPVMAHITVGDDQAAIEAAIRDAVGNCDFLIVTGGIGPTADDLTRQALAAVMGAFLDINGEWLVRLHEFFKARGRPMPEMNRIQAMIPRGAKMIDNPTGTAAGIEAELKVRGLSLPKAQVSDEDMARMFGGEYLVGKLAEEDLLQRVKRLGGCTKTTVFVLPGVPKEMKLMFQQSVLPVIRAQAGGGVILSRTLHTFGLGESAIAEMLGYLMDRTRNPSVGTTVSQGIVSLRINARFASQSEAAAELEKMEGECRRALGDLIYGQDNEALPEALARLLKEHPAACRWAPAVCTAESCTGGLLSKYLTDVAGSSTYFRQGWITYENEAKVNELGVNPKTLEAHGAVSEQTVREMAEGAARRSGAPFAMSISGIAGPGGGTAAKPVGTVCIGLSYPDSADETKLEVVARTFNFPGDREMVRDRACKMAMTMLRYHLLGKPLPF